MDLQLFLRVLWRFRLLVLAGVLLAAALAFLSMVRVSGDGLSYRESELWSSTTRVLVTQQGFPWGRATAEELDAKSQAEQLGVRFAPPDRFISLAVLYAQLAISDPIRQIMLREGPIRGQITAVPLVVQQNVALPLIDIVAVAEDPRDTTALGKRATAALAEYLRQQQETNAVPVTDRVVVQVLSKPKAPVLFEGRSQTLPIVIFLTAIIATIALAFILENLRPRVRPLPESVDPALPSAARRSA